MFDYNQRTRFEPGDVIRRENELAKSAPIFFGYDIENHFVAHLKKLTAGSPFDRLFFLTDRSIMDLFGGRFFNRLAEIFPATVSYLLPEGERSKSFPVLHKLCDQLVEQGVSKRSLLIAFGGGSIGNITGLAAGLIFRGIRFAEVPTTLLHQTDGTLSNKQAVNGKFGKNHFGIYHAPEFTWIDTKYLETEPLPLQKAGIVEGIKNGLIDQSGMLPYLKTAIKPDGDYNTRELTDLCYKLMMSKIEILKKDPTEQHYGMVLEYGHTFAHAVEWLSKGALSHGEAVAIGMKIAAELSGRLGYADKDSVALHYTLIDNRLKIKTALPRHITAGSVLDTMYVDNKKSDGHIKYVLLEKTGCCRKENGEYLVPVDRQTVYDVVAHFIETD